MTNQTPPTPTQETTPVQQEGNTKAALTYLVGWVTGLIFLFTEKDDEFVRFHAAQSVAVFGALFIIGLIPFIGFLTLIIAPVTFVLWILLMIKAYKGEKFMVPGLGKFAEQIEQKIK